MNAAEWNGRHRPQGESFGSGSVLIVGALIRTSRSSGVRCRDVRHNGRLVGRTKRSNPHLSGTRREGQSATSGSISKRALLDVVNFCALYRPGQEVTIGTGFRDTLCNPDGIFAAYHNIPDGVKKTLWLNPTAHHDTENWHGGKRILDILGKL